MNSRNPQLALFLRRFTSGTRIAWILVSASIVLAACGSGVATPGVANIGATPTTTLASSNSSGDASSYDDGLKYAACMRSHGIPDFPDPSANGTIQLGAGINPASSLFNSAQAKCQTLLPAGGFPSPGTATNPTSSALAAMLKVAQCMRAHGVSQFPDPTTKVPSKLPGTDKNGGVVSDRDGVILVLPGTLDMQSPQFMHAAAVCKFALTNH
jgi:hypothetical protein